MFESFLTTIQTKRDRMSDIGVQMPLNVKKKKKHVKHFKESFEEDSCAPKPGKMVKIFKFKSFCKTDVCI